MSLLIYGNVKSLGHLICLTIRLILNNKSLKIILITRIKVKHMCCLSWNANLQIKFMLLGKQKSNTMYEIIYINVI